MWLPLAMTATVTAMLPGCSGDTSSLPYTVRDSAGIAIVETVKGIWSEDERWTLSAEPVVTIGVEEGAEEYSLIQVRAALRLPDGNIVIADRGADQLRYYDSKGSFLYSVGRDGFGPGEFKRITGAWLAGDSIVVNDFGQDRLSIFSASGEYGRTLMLHRGGDTPPITAVGVFGDGTILSRQGIYDTDIATEPGLDFRRTIAVYRRHSGDGDVLDSLGTFLREEHLFEAVSSYTDPATGVGYMTMAGSDPPFGRKASVIAHGTHLYQGSSESYEINVFSNEGVLQRIIRRPITNRPVTEADKDRFREYWLEENGDWGRRRVLDLEYPETQPAHGPIVVDALGCLWVAEFSIGDDDRSGNWTVFNADGRMLGVVQVPVGGSYLNIGTDYVLGVWRTELDVEQVKMYRLFRN